MIPKNKIITRVLLVVVLGIYGTILYRSYANKKLTEEQVTNHVVDLTFSPANYRKDSFVIDFELNDPFRGNYSRRKKTASVQNPSPPLPASTGRHNRQPTAQIVQKKWPEVKYYGFVKSTIKPNSLCLLSVNGRVVKKEKGQPYEGVEIIEVYKDSIIVEYDDRIRAIPKQ